MQTLEQTIDYVMRYGGHCRDCADEDGICPRDGTPCEPAPKRAVIEHTLKALEYGISHGFIQSPFTRPAAPVKGLETIVKKAMQDEWEEICADTGCHPLDIEQLGRRRLRFSPNHWASAVAASVRSQAEAIIAGRDAVIETQADSIDKLERKVQHWQEEHEKLEALIAAKDAEIKRMEGAIDWENIRRRKAEAENAAAKKAGRV